MHDPCLPRRAMQLMAHDPLGPHLLMAHDPLGPYLFMAHDPLGPYSWHTTP